MRVRSTKSVEDGVKRKTRTIETKKKGTITRTKTKSKAGKTKSTERRRMTGSIDRSGDTSVSSTTNYRTKSKKGKGSASKTKGTKTATVANRAGFKKSGKTDTGMQKSRRSVTAKKSKTRY